MIMRSRLDSQLSQLNVEMTELGALCETAIANSARALVRGDAELAARVPPIADEIDRRERGIETLCMRMLLQQQPVAGDLRRISAALRMINDMERIGDQAKDIAEIIGFLGGRISENSETLRGMALCTIRMVTESVDAYVRRDIALARKVISDDDEVDERFLRVKRELISDIAKKPDDGEFALDILMIAKYLERIGDHAVNIAQWVIFSFPEQAAR